MILKPIVFDGDRNVIPQSKDVKSLKLNEAWLQDIIHNYPQIYPVENDLNTDLKIVSLGREIYCGAGYIDVLLLTSDAEILLIETKLWGNPEKSRTVLAQIMDYAKELSNWGYDDLNSAILLSQSNRKLSKIKSLKEIIKDEFPRQNLTDFEERLIQNLNQGNIKLSIIGDKISPNLLLLSDTIQKYPGLNFSLSLIEIKLFKYEQHLILIPDIVGKTVEVTRSVVKIQYEKEKPKVEIKYIESDTRNQSLSKTSKVTFISQCHENIAPLIDKLIEKWQMQNNLLIYWGIKGLSIRKLTDDKWTTILDIFPDCISMIIPSLAKKCKIPDGVYTEYLDSIFKIPELKSAYAAKKRYVYYKNLNTTDLSSILNSVDSLINKLTP